MARNDGLNRTVVRHVKLNQGQIQNAESHNERMKESYVNQDIMPARSWMNLHFKLPTTGYREMFRQMVDNGVISTRGLKADAETFGELVFDVNSAYFHNHGGYTFAREFFKEAYQAAIEIVGGEQYILSAVMHADERNRAMSEALGQDVYHYHLHVVYVPVVEKQILWSKRCKDKSLVGTVKETVMQVSMSKKWASKPAVNPETGEPLRTANGKPVLKKSYSVLQDQFFQHMRAAGYTDLERGERGSTEEHLTVTQFKVAQEETRLAIFQQAADQAMADSERLSREKEEAEAEAEQVKNRIQELAPKLKKIEELAKEFSADADQLLPEPGVLESGRTYREQKARPLVQKIVKVLRGIYRGYLDLADRYARLKKQHTQMKEQNESLQREINLLQEDRNVLKAKAEDYDTLCRGLSTEYVEAQVRQFREREIVPRIRPARKQGIAI